MQTPRIDTPPPPTPRATREAPVAREVPVVRMPRCTGGTVASEASSALQSPSSPASPPGLLFALTEQIVAQRVRQQAEMIERHVEREKPGSVLESARTTPVPRVRTPEAIASAEGVEAERPAAQEQPAAKSRSASRTMTSSSYGCESGLQRLTSTAFLTSHVSSSDPQRHWRRAWVCGL